MDFPHSRRFLGAVVLAVLATPTMAQDFIFSTGNYVPGVTAPEPLLAGDTLQINAGGSKIFSGVTFNNQGLVDWNADSVFLQSAAVINNGGLWDAHGDFVLVYNGGVLPTFANTGILRKSGGAGALTIGAIRFVNSGTLDAQSGVIDFNGSNATFDAGSVFTGAGSNTITSNAAFNGTFTSANLRLVGGTFTGTSAVINGHVDFTGGTVTGGWGIANGQSLRALDGGNKILSNTDFTNLGTLNWDTANSLFLQSATVLDNQGTIAVNESMSFVNNGGVLSRLVNDGTLRVAAGKTATMGAIEFVNNGLIDVLGELRLNGNNAAFNAGSQFTGSGVVAVNSNATFNGSITASPTLSFRAGTFTGANDFVIGGNPEWTGGNITGQWTIAAGQLMTARDGGNKILSNADFTNLGTLNWNTANSLFLQSATVLDNQGTIAVNESMSFVNNGGVLSRLVNDGTLRVAAGKTATMGAIEFVNNGLIDVLGELRLNGNNAAFNAGSQFTGSGVVAVNSNATFNGSITASPTLSFRAGTFTGANDFVIGGNPEWTGGNITGQWTIAAGQLMTARDGGNKILSNADFTNLGTLNWDTANSLFLQSATVLDNQGTIAVNESMSFVNNGGVLSRLVNDGTLRVAAGKTATMGAIEFGNNGLIDVQGVLNFSGNNATFNDGTEFAGTGVSNVGANARFVGSIESQNLRLSAGTQVGGDGTAGSKAILHGSTEFTGGAVTGHWDIAAGATLDARAGGNKFLLTATLTNKGSLNWETSDTWFLQSNADVLNQGTIAFETDNAIAYNGGAIGSFRNEGLIVKRGGSGTTSIGNNLGFVNAAGGIIDVQTGTLALPSNFGNDGTLMGTGTFASNAITNNGHVAPGASIGTLGISGAFTQSATGTLDIELENLTSFDLLTVSGITTLDGTLALHCFGSCVFDTDDEITILDSTGNLLGEFAAVSYFGFGMGEFEVIYDRIKHDVILRVLSPTSPVPLPAPFWLVVGGLGVLKWRGRRSQHPA